MAKQASATGAPREASLGTPREPGTAPVGPQGRKIDNNLGPGLLYPGVGRLVQRAGEPIYCGAMMGRCFGYTEHPNSKDPTKTSRRFAGQFIGITHDGRTINTGEAYLPGAIDRTIKAALDISRGHLPDPIEFAVEVWCEPDDRQSSTMGFRYACYDRKKQDASNPLLALAYESGLMDRPQGQLAAPAREEGVDPETGEVA